MKNCIQSGRARFRSNDIWKASHYIKLLERRQMVSSFVFEQLEETETAVETKCLLMPHQRQ